MDIAVFLSARWDEIETLARGATQLRWMVTRDPLGVHVENGDGRGRIVVDSGRDRADGLGEENAQFIAANDPANVLADIASKRAIVARYADMHWHAPAIPGATSPILQVEETGACRTCITQRLFASTFKAHPDFDPAWTVET